MQSPIKELLTTDLPLIGADDPPPFTIINSDGKAPVLVVCDHAGREFPGHMDRLGVDESVLDLHVAWDIGSARVGALLAGQLDAACVQASYSRLIVDLNRQLYDATVFPRVSDGIEIPGNGVLTDREKWLRVRSFYWPYHHAVTAMLYRIRARGGFPAIVSIHSCTPVFDRVVRPWHIGVLWDADSRISVPLLDALGSRDGICVGDNEPYSGRHPHDFTLDFHAEPAGLPHVGIEVRQDLIETEDGARHWAGVLGDALAPILENPTLFSPWSV